MTDDLLDRRGRLLRLVLAVIISAGISVSGLFGFGHLVRGCGSAAGEWFIFATVGFVFFMSMFALQPLLKRYVHLRPLRPRLPVARVRRMKAPTSTTPAST